MKESTNIVQVKRYANRKLYNTSSKSYITLDEIAGRIRSGEIVEVIDNETGKEITNQVLTQVIFEEGKKGITPIPSEVLHDLIRWGNQVIDQGVEQVVQGVDKLVQESISKWFPISNKNEMEQLEQKVAFLETLIEQLTTELQNTITNPTVEKIS